MPLYEYECENAHRFEEIQKFADAPIEHCPTCKAKAKRLMSTSNFALKGSGWYKDGYSEKPAQKEKDYDDTDFKQVAARTRKALIEQDLKNR